MMRYTMVNPNEFVPEKQRTKLTTGQMLRYCREFKGWTQKQLEKKSGIAATNISALENDHAVLGKDRSLKLAKAFGIHPWTLMFPTPYLPVGNLFIEVTSVL